MSYVVHFLSTFDFLNIDFFYPTFYAWCVLINESLVRCTMCTHGMYACVYCGGAGVFFAVCVRVLLVMSVYVSITGRKQRRIGVNAPAPTTIWKIN